MREDFKLEDEVLEEAEVLLIILQETILRDIEAVGATRRIEAFEREEINFLAEEQRSYEIQLLAEEEDLILSFLSEYSELKDGRLDQFETGFKYHLSAAA